MKNLSPNDTIFDLAKKYALDHDIELSDDAKLVTHMHYYILYSDGEPVIKVTWNPRNTPYLHDLEILCL